MNWKKSLLPISNTSFLVTLFTASLLLLSAWLNLSPLFEYDRIAVSNGELWRIITCHWVHWSFDHFFWCFIALGILGWVCEDISRRGYIATLIVSSVSIPYVLWIFNSDIQVYRGFSGVASSLFVFSVFMLVCDGCSRKEYYRVFLYGTAGFGYIGKMAYEYITGSTLFVNSGGIFVPVPLSHITGGIVGLTVALSINELKKRKIQRKSIINYRVSSMGFLSFAKNFSDESEEKADVSS